MTEERIKKMAEDYFCEGCENSFDHDNGHCSDCTKIQFYSAGVKDGYHECQKEHEWHDLRKNPDDLPDEGFYLVVWQNARGYRETMIMRYEEDDEEKLHWMDDEYDCWDDDVIAWREIPKFKENG